MHSIRKIGFTQAALGDNIEVPLPDKDGLKEIFKIHTKNMSLDKVDVDEIIRKADDFSGAEIKAICTEAGYFAIRGKRNRVKQTDFLKSLEKLNLVEDGPIGMFG